MDYKAVARAILDPENQPHQWGDYELAQFLLSAADEIERLRDILGIIAGGVSTQDGPPFDLEIAQRIARFALQQKESE